jgi:hypothetical protein
LENQLNWQHKGSPAIFEAREAVDKRVAALRLSGDMAVAKLFAFNSVGLWKDRT